MTQKQKKCEYSCTRLNHHLLSEEHTSITSTLGSKQLLINLFNTNGAEEIDVFIPISGLEGKDFIVLKSCIQLCRIFDLKPIDAEWFVVSYYDASGKTIKGLARILP